MVGSIDVKLLQFEFFVAHLLFNKWVRPLGTQTEMCGCVACCPLVSLCTLLRLEQTSDRLATDRRDHRNKCTWQCLLTQFAALICSIMLYR